MGQRTDPGAGPALLAVELVEELEEPVLGGVEVTGQGGDFGGERVRAFFPDAGGLDTAGPGAGRVSVLFGESVG